MRSVEQMLTEALARTPVAPIGDPGHPQAQQTPLKAPTSLVMRENAAVNGLSMSAESPVVRELQAARELMSDIRQRQRAQQEMLEDYDQQQHGE